MTNEFSPAWWLRNPHAQTLWGKFFRRQEIQPTVIRRLETPDADFLELHRLDRGPVNAPRLLILHGLEGGARSHYAQALLGEATARGWNADLLVFRSCGSEMNRAKRLYHSGETTDLSLAVDTIVNEDPARPLLLAGVSLGGNVLLKFLGERHHDLPDAIRGAAAVSVPFDLSRSARYIDRGFSKVYQRSFVDSLRRKALAKLERYPDLADPEKLMQIRTMNDFDNLITAPLHGFTDAEDYYQKSSSIYWLAKIRLNTLLLNAVDDPFLPPEVLDEVKEIASRNPALHLELPLHGGHTGFIGGGNPLRPRYFAERRVGGFLAAELRGSRAGSYPQSVSVT
ncbi:MAG TPA: hydrolase [Gemmatimonadaceae bacterium]